MKKTIIHVGLHKTATTFMQEQVWPALKEYTYLSRPYTQHNHAFNQLQYADDSVYQQGLLLKELEQFCTDRLLLSDESFSGKVEGFSNINRTMIATRLKDLFPDAEIIIFLRDQQDIMLSHYSSYVRMPYGTKNIGDFFYKPRRNYTYTDYTQLPDDYPMTSLYYNTNDFLVHLDSFFYSPLVDLYRNLFEKCHVFLYEDFRNNGEDTIARLEEIMEQHIEVSSFTPRNISLSHAELEVYRKANRLTAFTTNRTIRKLAERICGILPAAGSSDYKTQVATFSDGYYTEDNARLKARLPELAWEKHPEKYT